MSLLGADPAPPGPANAEAPASRARRDGGKTSTAGRRPIGAAWRRIRWPILLGAGIIVVAVLGVLAQAGGNARAFDPDGVSGQGSRALATLLRDRGVAVSRVPTVAAATAISRSRGPVTVFLPVPERLAARDLAGLPALPDGALVMVAPTPALAADLAPEIKPLRSAPVRDRRPACDAPAALVAGSAEMGGQTYELTGGGEGRITGCYPAGEGFSLVLGAGGGRVTVLGTGRPFTNDALGDAGNAALALSLLGTHRQVVWLLPRPGEVGPAEDRDQGLVDLMPDRLLLAVGQLALAGVVFALWRARRLGGVVAEPLPVVVRGTETTEGRARLYRAGSARGSAAAALRTGARRRLAARVGLGPDPSPETLVEAVAQRTGRPPEQVRSLVSGGAPPPADAAGLVRLADDLDTLAAEVRRP